MSGQEGPPFRVVEGRALPGASVALAAAPAPYASRAPALWGFRCALTRRVQHFAAKFARAEVAVPGEWVLRIPGAVIVNGKAVFGADGAGAAESFADMAMTRAAAVALGRLMARAAPETLAPGPAPVVHVFKEGAGNYGHLLAEILPKLVHVAALGLRRIRVPMPGEAAALRPVCDFAAAALGLEVEWLPCPPGSVLRVPELFWAGPVSRHDDRKSPTLLALRARLLAAVPRAEGPARLFVTRPPAAKRPVAELAEVEALMRARGFAVVEPAGLPFQDQLALFREARTVVGLLGAGLANALAMEPGGQMGMFDPGLIDCFFWDLACLGGQRFSWMFTRAVGRFEVEGLTRPWSLDPALAGEALDWMEEGARLDP